MPDLFDVDDLWPDDYERVLELATSDAGTVGPVLAGLGVALLFEKPSARTRNSSEMAVYELGGHPVYIQATEVGLDTRESAEDIARTLGCYHRIICARVFAHDVLPRMAIALEGSNFDVPVVNLLSDEAHPCQAIADAITLRELLGPLPGQILGYVGDSNNMCRSLVKMALIEGMDVRVASPTGYSFSAEEQDRLTALAERVGRGGTLLLTHDPEVAAGGADALYTDVWTSMGQEKETAERLVAFEGFMIDDALLDVAEPDVFVLHCLPAHRGEEISASVLEGSHSVVWKQAAHRQTAMRGILAWAVEEQEPGAEPGA
jgi:ornithine carbamoyltransferase